MYRIKTVTILIVSANLFLSSRMLGQKPEFQFSLQSWLSYTTYDQYDSTGTTLEETTTQLGFGIRRARLRGTMTRGKFIGFVQYDVATSAFTDAQLDYLLSDHLKLRMGRFVGPGSQAAGRTSHTVLDFTERGIVGRLYSIAVGRDDHRSYGMSLIGKVSFLNYEIMASNGDGSLSLKPYNTKSSNSDEDTGFVPQMDFMVYSKITKGLSGGIHCGLPSEKRINVSALTGYLYFQPADYKKGDLRGKLDLVHITDETEALSVSSLGYRMLAFYRVMHNMEIGIQYEQWDPNTDLEKDTFGNITVGLNYSPNPDHWKDTLFKLAATFKTSQAPNQPYDPLVIHAMWQLYMH
ncbi:hypothetical protein ACFL4L_00470 [bacterium]